MPAVEAMEPVPGQAVRTKLDGLRIHLGKSLGHFDMPSGVSVVMHTPMSIPEETDSYGLLRMLGQSNRLELPFVYAITAQLSPRDRVLRVGTFGYHETEMLHAFWQTHNQSVRISPIGKQDRVTYNGTCMEQGFTLPMPGADTVVFQATQALR